MLAIPEVIMCLLNKEIVAILRLAVMTVRIILKKNEKAEDCDADSGRDTSARPNAHPQQRTRVAASSPGHAKATIHDDSGARSSGDGCGNDEDDGEDYDSEAEEDEEDPDA